MAVTLNRNEILREVCEAKEVPEIPAAIERLQTSAQILHDRIQVLNHRLHPVLRQVPVNPETVNKGYVATTEIADCINQVLTRIEDMHELVSVTLDRLEV
jgi:hypothetical protein